MNDIQIIITGGTQKEHETAAAIIAQAFAQNEIKQWNEADHPRADDGQFSSSGSHSEHTAAQQLISKQLTDSGLPESQQKKYAAAANQVLSNMTPNGLTAFNSFVGNIQFCRDDTHLQQVAGHQPGVDVGGGKIGALSVTDETSLKTSMVLDGDVGGAKAVALYAYAFANAINVTASGDRVSETPEWLTAWRDEISGGKISAHADTSVHEGFNEFGRLLLSGEQSENEVKSTYPKAYAVWVKNGLR